MNITQLLNNFITVLIYIIMLKELNIFSFLVIHRTLLFGTYTYRHIFLYI